MSDQDFGSVQDLFFYDTGDDVFEQERNSIMNCQVQDGRKKNFANIENNLTFGEQNYQYISEISQSNIQRDLNSIAISTTLNQRKKKMTRRHGEGPEVEKMIKKYQHFRESFDNCKIYNGFKRPEKQFFVNLGLEYNLFFKEMIKRKKMPKFKRDHQRNMGLAIWFFEDNLPIIYNWLVSTQNFQA